jgi:non-heme chloroperoxidase
MINPPVNAPGANVRRIMERQWRRAMTAELPPLQHMTATAPDGVNLAVQSWGNPDGAEILFIHGYSQCHLTWRRQMTDPDLARQFRMISYDLRGHGASDKPAEPERYRDDRIWADDLAAVIEAAGLRRPLLVAWSYAGRVVSDYVSVHGQQRIAGINYVNAFTNTDRRFWGPDLRYTVEMASSDLMTSLRATRKFVHSCFASRPAGDEMELTLTYVMLSPAPIRRMVLARSRNEGAILSQLRVPVLVTHGGMDRIISPAMASYTAEQVPGAKLSIYGGVGHSPFFEDAERFNRELAEFAMIAHRQSTK